jgi:tetratricopeptide (TPR) repeat protein
MIRTMQNWWMTMVLAGALAAQAETGAPQPTGKGAPAAVARIQISDAGKAALSAARELVQRTKGLQSAERLAALQQAAAAYDRVVADFAGEPPVAGPAAFAAAELWRQHGSPALAEKSYLLAAEIDAGRFGARAWLGAAEMQQRQKRLEQALESFGLAVTAEPGGLHAHEARLAQARLLETLGKPDAALGALRSALESARPGRQGIEAANLLALALVRRGDFEGAERAIEHAQHEVTAAGDEDAATTARLQKLADTMSAKKALQRARDKQNQAGAEAAQLDGARRQGNN